MGLWNEAVCLSRAGIRTHQHLLIALQIFLPSVCQYFTCVEDAIHDLIDQLLPREKLVIQLRVLRWEYSTEVFHSAELLNCLLQ